MYNTDIYHSGVLGMHWGVRKDKNVSTSTAQKKTSKKPKELSQEERKAKLMKSHSAKEIYAHKDSLSDQELKTVYSRLALEDNLRNLSNKEISKGEQYVNNAINVGNKVGDVINAGTKAYNGVAKVYNTFSEGAKSNPLPLIKDGGNSKKKK